MLLLWARNHAKINILPCRVLNARTLPIYSDAFTAPKTGRWKKSECLSKKTRIGSMLETKRDLTPMHLAASYGHTKVVEFLLSNPANPNLKDWQGATPLVLSTIRGHHDIARLLRTHVATDD